MRFAFPAFWTNLAKAREGNASDIYLNTSRIDNAPVAVLEAAAMGLPVVATKVGGVPHLLEDGRSGLLVADDDHAAMINAIRRLLGEPELAKRLSTNGRSLAERASWSRVFAQWHCLFARIYSE